MHLRENTLSDRDLGINVTQNVAQYNTHHVTYSPVKFVGATSNSLRGYAFTRKPLYKLNLGVKVTQNVTQYSLHHVIYAPTKFEVDVSNS